MLTKSFSLRNILRAVVVCLFLLSQNTFAYYSTLTTGDILPQNRYDLSAGSQFASKTGSTVNFVSHLDLGLSSSESFRAVVGFGDVDFQFGGFYKWVPYPDTLDQPALGIMAGVLYGRTDDENEINVRVHPLMSKKFLVNYGEFNPYITVPFGVRMRDGEMTFPVQVEIGSEFSPLSLKKVKLIVELGFDVSEAFNYLSLAGTVAFDEEGILVE